MNSSIPEAKKRLIANIGTNMLAVFVGAAIGIWQTPYLIRHFGIEVYGMIPLVISFIAYFNLLTASITNAVTRFVAIHLGKGEEEQGNTYFNSALFALIILCGILLIPVIILSAFFSKVFQVPAGFETDTSWMFFYVIFSTFIMAVNSPFLVSTFVRHRFDLSNSVKMVGRLLRVIFYVVCFMYLSVSLKYFGLSYIVMALFVLVCSIVLTKCLTPQLQVNWRRFSWLTLREMGRMSAWIAINQVGALLYLSVSFIIINLFLGPEQCGRYAPVALWVTLLGALGGALSDVFAPIAFEYIARDRLDILVLQIRRSTKFLGLIMGLPVGLLCGLAVPVLTRWLGPDFTDLWPLVWLLIAPWLITITIRPMFAIYRGLDKVKLPAVATLLGGVINVLLSVSLVCYTNLGIFGIAVSLLVCIVAKNLFFTPVYAAIITNQPKTIFMKEIVPGSAMAALVLLVTFVLSSVYNLASIPKLLGVSVLVMAVYAPVCYGLLMTKEERALLWSLIFRNRFIYK